MDADHGLNVLPNVLDPEAANPQDVCPGYTAVNVQKSKNGFTADLNLAGEPCDVYGNDVKHLSLSVQFQADNRINVQIQPRYIGRDNETWFVLPDVLVERPVVEPGCIEANNKMMISWGNEPSFHFTVKHKETGDTLFTTEGRKLVYEDQFIEFGSSLPENYNLYGLGETAHGFRLGNNLSRTLFAADVGDSFDANLYGSHPIYLDTRYFTKDDLGRLTYQPNATDRTAKYVSYTHGVFLRNAHSHEILLHPEGITWRMLGGSIDLYFYTGPKAEDVIRSYQQSTVGLPAMQQYWTLGFQQSRWGYKSWKELQDVIDNFAKFDMPLETVWSDIDVLNQKRDFTVDPENYSESDTIEFLNRLHANKQHYVPIVDAAIYAPNPENASDAYPPYDRGLEANAFLMNPDGSVYYGAVWPGFTVFPDWIGAALNGTQTVEWWINELVMWSEKVAFDGIWVDMNEAASFCVGSCGTGRIIHNPAHAPFELPGEPGNRILQYPEGFEQTNETEASSASSAWSTQYEATKQPTATQGPYITVTPTPGARNIDWPPYVINNFHNDVAVHAVSPNATHHGGTKEYDFHNLYGHESLRATYKALLAVFGANKRPFIIGRSTFAGSGKWAGHWGGDNESRWPWMYLSIPQALSFSIFGIPMFGVDTCGFGGNSDMELCNRWMQLSAFFPFYRNHNTLSTDSQEPYRWASVIDASKKAMRIRYLLLPYMYTLMMQASLQGNTVMRALSWEFPEEPWLAGADRQFMLGGAVMVTPNLVQGADTVDGVFPGVNQGTIWYDWYDHSTTFSSMSAANGGLNVTIPAPLSHIPVYLRGGRIVPVQEPALTTADSRHGDWGLLVALDKDGNAEGELYLDDGESIAPGEVTWVTFSAEKGSKVVATPAGNYRDTNPLANVTVMGLTGGSPKVVMLNGKEVVDNSKWTFESDKGVLYLTGLQGMFEKGAWDRKWEVSWR